ncbi:MAG: hypothetical protein ACOVSR_06550 [Bacteroidia bacterium]
MKNKAIISFLFIFHFFISIPFTVEAQCPMCKQSLVSARADGDTNVGNTLNNGIIYLFVFPYILAMVFLFLYIRNVRIKKKVTNFK